MPLPYQHFKMSIVTTTSKYINCPPKLQKAHPFNKKLMNKTETWIRELEYTCNSGTEAWPRARPKNQLGIQNPGTSLQISSPKWVLMRIGPCEIRLAPTLVAPMPAIHSPLICTNKEETKHFFNSRISSTPTTQNWWP